MAWVRALRAGIREDGALMSAHTQVGYIISVLHGVGGLGGEAERLALRS